MRRRLLILALLLAAAAAPAAARGKGPDADVDAAFLRLEFGDAEGAVAAFRRLFVDWRDHPRIVEELDRIEAGFRRAAFLAGYRGTDARDLVDDHLQKLDPDTRRVEIDFPDGPEGRWWTPAPTPDRMRFDVEFGDDVAVEPLAADATAPDFELVEGETGRRVVVAAAPGEGFRVRGVLDPDWLIRRKRELRERAFTIFSVGDWDRSKEIPAWARDAAEAARRAGVPGGPPPPEEEFVYLADLAFSGRRMPALTLEVLATRDGVPARTALYARAASDLLLGRTARALAGAKALVATAPGWAEAQALLALVRGRLRDRPAAEAAIARALELDPGNARAWQARLDLAMLDYDLDATIGILDAARAASVRSPVLAAADRDLRRAAAGPGWEDPETILTPRFEIRSPESRDACRLVAHTLESALRDYAAYFPETPPPRKRARVWIFPDRASWLRWGRECGRDLGDADGVYYHLTRELSFHETPGQTEEEFLRVVRHEGFHRFLGLYLDEPPPWLGEGGAEYFSHCREKFGGGIAPGEDNPRARRLLAKRRRDLPPLRRLLTMDAEDFMRDAALHYAQSWALVRHLLEDDPHRLRPVFRATFTALTAGATPREAFEAHLAPILDRLEADYLAFLDR